MARVRKEGLDLVTYSRRVTYYMYICIAYYASRSHLFFVRVVVGELSGGPGNSYIGAVSMAVSMAVVELDPVREVTEQGPAGWT